MNTRLFISGIVIFTIAGFVFMHKMMESTGGIAAVIGLLIALAGIVEKNK